MAATTRDDGGPTADPNHQRQGAAGADLDGRPDALPGCGHHRALWSSLGNRAGVSGDETQPATAQADPAQQEGGGHTARVVGRAAGVQPATQSDGEDGSKSEGIHGEPTEFSHGVGVPHS
ncbi:hypothetical protein D3C73_1386660 [compost metagenome]